MGRVQDKIALVTGAANGLGRATAELFAREGAIVLLTDIDDRNGEATAAAICANNGRARYMHHDASKPEDWNSVLDALRHAHGRLDILINNAGGGTYNDIETVTLAEWRRIMSINLDATFIGTQAAIRWMKETGGGSIVNVSSVAAFVGSPNLAAYCAAKAGINLLSKSAGVYCGQKGYGIRVNSVHPGLVETKAGVEMARLATGAGSDEEAIAMFTGLHPIGRIGQPDDIAQGILYLASDDSSFVTGSSLVIDGGFTAI
ncbi:glucose 1-dehydrogenase [Azoarcus sp. L1K30]|uniref:glucose 1-dehydrogenase n=1 Tax=Azoarcus sp. L1K30 TaxID=2820277 RepID=UPI001B834BA7|nr:glucose 1-dehydrogenase [Azoarcus sp. L1K30]MBR0567518.1 glucose 1-dehydrogenase [Azoarcus sp. L1K30]